MRRNPFLVAMHSLLTAGVLAMVGIEFAAGDGWRTAGSAFVLVCLLVVRDDLTRSEP